MLVLRSDSVREARVERLHLSMYVYAISVIADNTSYETNMLICPRESCGPGRATLRVSESSSWISVVARLD